MKVILKKIVDNLGASNELVDVKPGYARNYLIPNGLAVEASQTNIKIMEEKNKVASKKEGALLSQISDVQKVLNDSNVVITTKIGTSGKIFGSITSLHLVKAIKEQKGYEIDRKKIHIVEDVKMVGTYDAVIDFGNEKKVEFKFDVVGEEA